MPASLRIFRRICWIGVAIWVATVFTLSSLTGPQVEELNVFNAWDKLLHFLAFFCGALPLVPALGLSRPWPVRKIVRVSIACLSLYGALDEVHQVFTPSRSALDPGDWLADTLGSATGVALAIFVYVRYQRKNRASPSGA